MVRKRNLHLKTPDGEVVTSIFRLIGSHRDRVREFGHASCLHGSGYKSTGLNHRVGHAKTPKEKLCQWRHKKELKKQLLHCNEEIDSIDV
jgi:hypothetical protein